MNIKPALLLSALMLVAAALACRAQETPHTTEVTPLTGQDAPTRTPDYSGPCANVLFPFLEGRQWVYQKVGMNEGAATPDPLTSRFGIAVTEVSGSQAVLQAADLGTGATSKTTADCQNGAILNLPVMILGSLFGDYLSGDVQVQYVSGVFAPSASDLEAAGWNMSWEGQYIASGVVTFTSEGERTTITLSDSPLRIRWQTAGRETVVVPAGTFENAYKVTRLTQVDAGVTLEGMTGRATVTIETVHWFAPYVGLLKSEVVSGNLTTFGITFPVEVGGAVELVETR